MYIRDPNVSKRTERQSHAISILPPEICVLICAEVEDPGKLAILCRTSRLFLDQAQRILYHTVDLEGRPMRSVRSWALAVTRHSHLAERVHALSLQLPETLKLSPSDATKVQRALSACVNLKELKFSCIEVYGHGNRPDSIHGWMINEAPFRLTKFANTYFNFSWITDFWIAQSQIRVLSIPHSYSSSLSTKAWLPNLIAVAVSSLQALPVERPLQRIEASIQRDFSLLAQFSRTLTTLNLVGEWVDHELTLFDVVANIADLLPALVHLGISELVKRDRSIVERAPMGALQRFSGLETFVILVRNVVRFTDIHAPRIYKLENEKDLEDLGSAIITACLTLRRVVVGAEAQLDRELTCTLTRILDGKIQSDRGAKMNLDAVSMFWKP
ncbi:hypothetical protein B0H19DRAFT_1247247 [Mycena capillaripes]|nr:hypothetical protein B0H19DRAFT_1247247 [Mycena capillaripes]